MGEARRAESEGSGRRPFALANWKMAMTIGESRAFVARLLAIAGDLPRKVEMVLCPPCTALYAVSQALAAWPIAVGAQNLSPHRGASYTGQVSAELVADAGCRWALLGHWEVRRYLGDDDALVNRKIHRALATGLCPVVSVGEGTGRREQAAADLERQLPVVLEGCTADQVGKMVFLYEPEWTIGVEKPAPLAHVQVGCQTIRSWLQARYGPDAAERARIIYGGSVSAEFAAELLDIPDVDGLGVARRGRDPEGWMAVVRLIAGQRGGSRHNDHL